VPSEQTTAVPCGTTMVFDGGGGLLLLMQADRARGRNKLSIMYLRIVGPSTLS